MIASSFGFFNLVLLVITTALLLFGMYEMKYRQRTTPHAAIMSVAWLLTVASVLFVMVPSLTDASSAIVAGSDWRFTLMFVHHILGLFALIVATALAGSWLLRGRKPNSCLGKPKNKRLIMRTTFSLWLLSMVLGIVLWFAFI